MSHRKSINKLPSSVAAPSLTYYKSADIMQNNPMVKIWPACRRLGNWLTERSRFTLTHKVLGDQGMTSVQGKSLKLQLATSSSSILFIPSSFSSSHAAPHAASESIAKDCLLTLVKGGLL